VSWEGVGRLRIEGRGKEGITGFKCNVKSQVNNPRTLGAALRSGE
jgi:hypothetical protein